MGMYSFLYMFFKVILTTEALDNRNVNDFEEQKSSKLTEGSHPSTKKSSLFGLGNKDKLTSDNEKDKNKLTSDKEKGKSKLFGLGNKDKLTSDKEKGKSKLLGLGNKDKLTSDKEKGKSKLFGLGGSKKSSLFGLGG